MSNEEGHETPASQPEKSRLILISNENQYPTENLACFDFCSFSVSAPKEDFRQSAWTRDMNLRSKADLTRDQDQDSEPWPSERRKREREGKRRKRKRHPFEAPTILLISLFSFPIKRRRLKSPSLSSQASPRQPPLSSDRETTVYAKKVKSG